MIDIMSVIRIKLFLQNNVIIPTRREDLQSDSKIIQKNVRILKILQKNCKKNIDF